MLWLRVMGFEDRTEDLGLLFEMSWLRRGQPELDRISSSYQNPLRTWTGIKSLAPL